MFTIINSIDLLVFFKMVWQQKMRCGMHFIVLHDFGIFNDVGKKNVV